MPLRRLTRHAKAAWEVPRDLLLGRYPGFVTGGPLPKGHVPVFVFHSLEAESFGRKLQYLADNHYVTLSADEYFQALMGSRPALERAVVLTFDDGRASLFDVGYPLMKRHGMTGIVFLVPGRIGPPRGPTAGAESFLTWEQIGELSRSGLFDFQSHTLTHARIHTTPQVADFMSPRFASGFAAMDAPLIREGSRDLMGAEVPMGTPFFRSEPRTSEARRFYEDPEVRKACTDAVAEAGGEGFFYQQGWERTLKRLLNGRSISGRLETAEERESAIRHELFRSKEMIEERSGKPVVHLCYPWHVSGPTARRLAREVGYRAAFCGKVAAGPITLPGGDPQAIARIGEDYVELLPGRGRVDLASVLRQKWSRRLRGQR